MKTKAFAGALRLLVRREHGTHELVNKLLKKGYPAPEIHEAIAECQRLGLQSDQRFVENVTRARIRQGYGPIRIRQELQALQIDRELVDHTLSQEQENWLGYAIEVWKKKYKDRSEPSFSAIQKQKQFLLYRGFSTDTISMLFNELNTNKEKGIALQDWSLTDIESN